MNLKELLTNTAYLIQCTQPETAWELRKTAQNPSIVFFGEAKHVVHALMELEAHYLGSTMDDYTDPYGGNSLLNGLEVASIELIEAMYNQSRWE